MKSNMGQPRAAGDFKALLKAYERLSASTPDPAWADWIPISKQGAAAAKGEDMKAVKQTCNGCHEKYKDQYKERFSARPFP